MEPAGQAVHIGMSCAAPVGEGTHSPHRSSLTTTDPGPVGEECWEDQSRRQAESWPPRALVCGSKQTSQHQSRCSSVSDPSEFIHSRVPIGLGKTWNIR